MNTSSRDDAHIEENDTYRYTCSSHLKLRLPSRAPYAPETTRMTTQANSAPETSLHAHTRQNPIQLRRR